MIVRFRAGVFARIDAVEGKKNRRAEFIREAVEAALQRLETEKG